MGSVAPFFFQ
jgi:hypothetical protein